MSINEIEVRLNSFFEREKKEPTETKIRPNMLPLFLSNLEKSIKEMNQRIEKSQKKLKESEES